MGKFILEFQIGAVKATIALSVLSKNRTEVGLPLTERFIHSRKEKIRLLANLVSQLASIMVVRH